MPARMAFDTVEMTIEELGGDAARLYNSEITRIPHCHPVTPSQFKRNVRLDRYTVLPDESLGTDQLIITLEDGSPTGFIHLALLGSEAPRSLERSGVVRFFCFQPDRKAHGQALIEEADRWFRDRGSVRIGAFAKASTYRFYFPGLGCSERHGHIVGLLGVNGYRITERGMLLNWPCFEVVDPNRPPERLRVTVDRIDGEGKLPNLRVTASRGTETVGGCETYSLGHMQPAAEEQNWIYVKWLGVDERYQGKGWGRYLLHRVLWEARRIGYTCSCICTSVSNHRALLLYTSLGYRVVHSMFEFSKFLGD